MPHVPSDDRRSPHPIAYRVRGTGGVCEQTGWSPTFVYQRIADGSLPSVRVGRSVAVLHDDLIAFLEANRTGSAA